MPYSPREIYKQPFLDLLDLPYTWNAL